MRSAAGPVVRGQAAYGDEIFESEGHVDATNATGKTKSSTLSVVFRWAHNQTLPSAQPLERGSQPLRVARNSPPAISDSLRRTKLVGDEWAKNLFMSPNKYP